MSYSAGTAWLQVIPSFRHIERKLREDVARVAKTIDNGLRAASPALSQTLDDVGKQAAKKVGAGVQRGVKDGVNKGLTDAGTSTDRQAAKRGADLGGAFARAMAQRLDAAIRSLPDVPITADSSEMQKAIADVRKGLVQLREQHIKLEIDDETAIVAVERFRARLRSLERAQAPLALAGTRGDIANLRTAGGELDVVTGVAATASRSGAEAGGTFGGAFAATMRRRVDQALQSLPEVDLRINSSPVDGEIARIRLELQRLGTTRIGVDMDPAEFMARFEAINRDLETLAERAPTVPLRFNVAQAAKAMQSFTRDVAPQEAERAGEETGERFAGAFVDQLTGRLDRAIRSLPDVPITPGMDAYQNALAKVREDLQQLREEDIADTRRAAATVSRIAQLQRQLERLGGRGVSIDIRTNAAAAATELAAFGQLVRNAQQAGRDVGERFGGAFATTMRKRLDQVVAALPEIEVTVASTGVDRQIADIRRRLETLRDRRIGVDIDADQFVAQVRQLTDELTTISEAASSLPLRFDLTQASATMRKFTDDVAPQQGKEAAEEFAGAFQDMLRMRLDRALKSIPEVQLGVNASDADRELQRIRAQMQTLRDARIGVNLDASSAMAEATALLALLRRLDNQDVNVEVRTNAAAAAVEVSTFVNVQGQLAQKLDDTTEAAQATLGRLGAMISAGLSIGTMIIPAAAGAAVAVVGIATAAAAAAAGLAVLGLGFSGIGGAVKALDAYAKDAGKSAKSLSQANVAVANAADGVRQAERAVTNARIEGANAAKRASQAIVDAQRGVRDAQRDAVEAERDAARARRDLTRAYEEAARKEEDRRLAERDNALAQRKATLEIKAAKKELEKVTKEGSKATKDEREEAAVAYEQQLLRLDELKVAARRSSEDQKREARDGSEVVVAAQERVRDANERVVKANERVAQAQQRVAEAVTAQTEVQRQNAQRVIAANEQLVQAQRALGQAYINTGTAGGEALDKVRESMDALSPAGQRFALFLYGLKDEALALREVAQEGLLPGVQDALTELLPAVPAVTKVVGYLSEGLGRLSIEAVRALYNPVWKAFMAYLAGAILPSLQQMFRISETAARGLIALYLSLTPFNRPMGQGLLSMVEDFARWAEHLDETEGYIRFLNYVEHNGPLVVDTVSELTRQIIKLVVAAAPIGTVVTHGFLALLTVLDQIPVPVLSAIVTLVGLLSVALLANAAAMRSSTMMGALATNTGLLRARVMTALTTVTTTYTGATTAATAATGRFAVAQGVAAGAMAVTRTAAVGLGAALMNPWVLGITTAIAALSLLFYQARDVADETDALKNSLLDLADTYRATDGSAASSIEAMIKQNKELRDLIVNTQRYGFAIGDVVAAIEGDLEARNRLLGEYDREIKQLEDLKKLYYETSKAHGGILTVRREDAEAMRLLNQAGFENIDQLTTRIEQLLAEREALKGSTDEVARAKNAADLLAASNIKEALAQAELNRQMRDTAFQAQALKRAYDDLYGGAKSREEAILREAEAYDRLRAARERNGPTLDKDTEAGRENRRVVMERITALQDLALADIAATGTISADTQKRIDGLQQELVQMGFNKDEIKRLIGIYLGVPPKVITEVILLGGADAQGQLNEVGKRALELIATYNLKPHEAMTIAKGGIPVGWWPSTRPGRLGSATGGHVAETALAQGLIQGPGSATSDSIPAMLSHDEFVEPAHIVQHYGVPFFEALRQKRIAKDTLPGFAIGGWVGQKASNTTDVRQTPSWEELRKYNQALIQGKVDEMQAAMPAQGEYGGQHVGPAPGFLPWPSSPAAQRGDSGVWKSIMNLVQSSGIKYTFGNAYRHGDDKWHGSGRAVDFMGYDQDALAQFLLGFESQLLELIHLTPRGGYFVTRGKRVANMATQGPLHRNHLHVAMDQGGIIQPGWNPPIWNGTGKPEPVLTNDQWRDVSAAAQIPQQRGGPMVQNSFTFADTTLTPGYLEAMNRHEAARHRSGRPR